MLNIAEIRAVTEKATPGPWKWSCAPCNQQILLVTDHSGEYYVMGFDRWGMHNAAPVFQVYEKYDGPVAERGSKGMVRADKLCKSIPGKEHHVGFDDYIDHPDAAFIASARRWVPALCDEVERLQKIVDDYAAAARVISLHLRQFCNPALPYGQMVEEASRRADKRISELEKENARLKSKLDEDIHEENKILYKADLAQQNRIHDLQVARAMLKKALELACDYLHSGSSISGATSLEIQEDFLNDAKEEMEK